MSTSKQTKKQCQTTSPIKDDEFIFKCIEDIEANIKGIKEEKFEKQVEKTLPLNVLSESRLESLYYLAEEIKIITKYEHDERSKYWRDIGVLFTNVRLFKEPSMMEESPTVSSTNNDRSFHLLLSLLLNKEQLIHYLCFETNVSLLFYEKGLEECMLDLLEDVSRTFSLHESLHTLVRAVLTFLSYYSSFRTSSDIRRRDLSFFGTSSPIFQRDLSFFRRSFDIRLRDLSFLEKYLSDESSVKVYSAVVLYNFKGSRTYENILRDYLEKESQKEDGDSRDIFMVYQMIIRGYTKDGTTLSRIDYECISHIKKIGLSQRINDQIINIFDKVEKEGILKRMEEDSPFSEREKISIKCLSLTLQSLRCPIRGDTLTKILSLMEELFPYIKTNMAASRLTETTLYNLTESEPYMSDEVRGRLYKVCIKCWSLDDISEEMKVSSAVISSRITSGKYYDEKMVDVFKYLFDLVQEMKEGGSKMYLGYSEEVIKESLVKMMRTCLGKWFSNKPEYSQSFKRFHDSLRIINDYLYKYEKSYVIKRELSPLLMDVMKEFNNQYKEYLFIKIKKRESLEESDKLMINCITYTISVAGLCKDHMKNESRSIIDSITKYLEGLGEAQMPNYVAMRMAHIFLYTLCDFIKYDPETRSEEMGRILWGYFSKPSYNDNIKLSSGYLLLYLYKKEVLDTKYEEDMDMVKDHVRGIISRAEGSEEYLGFKVKELKVIIDQKP